LQKEEKQKKNERLTVNAMLVFRRILCPVLPKQLYIVDDEKNITINAKGIRIKITMLFFVPRARVQSQVAHKREWRN
jgi:hypothetical protein